MEKFFIVYASEYIGPVFISTTLEAAEENIKTKKSKYWGYDYEKGCSLEGCATIRVVEVVDNEMHLLETRDYENCELVYRGVK